MIDRSEVSCDPRDPVLRQAVLSYLREHPRAMDSLEGIADWWVLRQQIRVEVQRVASVLEEMTRRGELERVEEGRQVLYRLPRSQGGATAGPSNDF